MKLKIITKKHITGETFYDFLTLGTNKELKDSGMYWGIHKKCFLCGFLLDTIYCYIWNKLKEASLLPEKLKPLCCSCYAKIKPQYLKYIDEFIPTIR